MKIFLNSLGCDKNLCDGEEMLGLLAEAGYLFTDEISEADIIIINSCCFIGDAQEESINAIIEAGAYKKTGRCRMLIVSGCLSQRFSEEIMRELPEVDGILGTASYGDIVPLIEKIAENGKTGILGDINAPVHAGKKKVLCTGGHYAYLKIAEGCDKRCTYCIIPYVRGSYRSIPIEELVKQAKELVSGGVRELILVAQETTLYGLDLYGKKTLPLLLRKLSEIEELSWIRLMYCYPEEITDELLDEIASNKKVVNYLDIPVQSASDAVLKAMGRRTDKASLVRTINRIREKVPDIALRTTLISGFPGETQSDHEATLKFVRDMRFDRLGVFPYSKEDGTPAARMKGQILESVKKKRRDEIMTLQQQISLEKSEEFVGRRLKVFIEGRDTEDDIIVARTYRDAPEVDGYIFIDSNRDFISGEIVTVTVTGATEYDLTGELSDEETEFA